MTKLKMVCGLIFLSGLLLVSSCVRVPLEFTLNKEIEMTEAEVNKIAERIYDHMAVISFDHPPLSRATIDPKDCSATYKTWLRKQFDIGYLPKGIITAAEYGESSKDPKIVECRSVDFEKEYEEAEAKSASSAKREAVIFNFDDIKNKLTSNKCTESFLDPDKEKLELDKMSILVLENTLSVPAPIYTFYTSDEALTKDDFAEPDAEQTLLEDGEIYKLALSRPIAPRFVGRSPVDFIKDKEKFEDAVIPVVSLEGSVVAAPQLFAGTPETTEINGNPFYVIPRGHIRVRLIVQFSLIGSLRDAKCSLDVFKDAIKKEDEPRRENYNKR